MALPADSTLEQIVSDYSVLYLRTKVPMLNVFTTDFSNEIMSKGNKVYTRVMQPIVVDPAGGISATRATNETPVDFDNALEYPTDDLATTDVEIELSEYEGTGYYLTDLDASLMKSPTWISEQFVPRLIDPMIRRIFYKALDEIPAPATQPSGFALGSGHITASDLLQGSKELWRLNVPVGDMNVSHIVSPEQWACLLSDTDEKLINRDYVDGSPIRTGEVGSVWGSPVYVYNDLPTTKVGVSKNITDANEFTVGMTLHKEALACVTRQIAVPTDHPGRVTNITDPMSGFTMQLRMWYDPDKRLIKTTVSSLYGFKALRTDLVKHYTIDDGII